MAVDRFWKPGEHVLLRDIPSGRVRSAIPVTVVEHNERRLVTFLCEGTRFVVPADWDRKDERDFFIDPGYVEMTWAALGQTMIVYSGDRHSVIVRWGPPERTFTGWYVNLQSPGTCSPRGFDFTDHMLDVLVSPDGQSHGWKDEEELASAVVAGFMTAREAEAIRAEGLRVIERARRGLPPFNEPWGEWAPDPGRTVPELPDGWDAV